MVSFTLFSSSCVLHAASDVANEIQQQQNIEDIQLQADELKAKIMELTLRQILMKEFLIYLFTPTPLPFNFDDREEEVNNAV